MRLMCVQTAADAPVSHTTKQDNMCEHGGDYGSKYRVLGGVWKTVAVDVAS
jgi:hypothetical protein